MSARRTSVDATYTHIKAMLNASRGRERIERENELARYYCIVVYGYVEQSVRDALESYALRHGDECLQNFVQTYCRKRFNSARFGEILDLLKWFNESWAKKLKERHPHGDSSKTALESLVADRHKVAHGESSFLTVAQVHEWYEDVQRIVESVAEITAE